MATYTTSGVVNLYGAPSNVSWIRPIAAGVPLEGTGQTRNGYVQVRYNGQTVWVPGNETSKLTGYTPTSPQPTTGTPPTAPPPTGSTPTTGGSTWPKTSTTNTPGSTLNLRSGPSTQTSVLWSIPNGASITLTGPATNGWFPVSVNGKTGFVSAQYVNAPSPANPTTPTTPPPTTTPTTPAPTPPAIPHTPSNPNQQSGSNPFYNPNSTYGSHQNWYDTPLVKQNTNNFDAEWERTVSNSGFGGNNRLGNIARSFVDRAKSGYTAATMNNPNLNARTYLNDSLGPNFLRDQIAKMTPTQKGEMHSVYRPASRWIDR
jgi:uncharacterized protein YraI